MSTGQPKAKRARIVAPAVKAGNEFEVIRPYWFTTHVQLNPFIGSPRCRECKMPACFERHVGDLHGGAVTVREFACPQGHVWEDRLTND